MLIRCLTFYAALIMLDALASCKCFQTECNILSRRRCPDGYVEKDSKPCLFGILGYFYLCCLAGETPDFTTTQVSTTSAITTTTEADSLLKCERAKQRELPYVVAMTRDSNAHHFCSGSLLSPFWVLTSARCLFDLNNIQLNPSDIIVKAGSLNVQDFEGTEQFVIADQILIHEDYDNITQYANLALVHLVYPFEFNEYVSSISLPPKGFDTKSLSRGLTAGWKIKDPSAALNLSSSYLLKVDVPIIDDKICSEIFNLQFELKGNVKTHRDSRICTVGNSQHKACLADAGGILRCQSYICGIASVTGSAGESEDIPDIYTDVTFFTEFIERTVDDK